MDAMLKSRIALHRFADDGRIPNNPCLPAIVYPQALAAAADPAEVFERLFAANGWPDGWRNGIFGFHHYHSTAHEVLGIARGGARVLLGGEKGAVVEVGTGDVLVIPAGVGHKRLSAAGDLLVIGCYPRGQSPDLCKGEPGERPRVLDAIARVPLPVADPVLGADGPLMREWRAAMAAA
jgi:uncharacterized protein YjlB